MDAIRSWPTENHYRALMTGSLEQLHNLYAYLPMVQTDDQDYFITSLVEKIREKESQQ